MMSFGFLTKMRTVAKRCCSPPDSTRDQSQTPPKPSSKRSGRPPSPTLARCLRRSASDTCLREATRGSFFGSVSARSGIASGSSG
mmetsp:Transcript_13197/g.41652  ORF Transcript_13197/g.41652 Transcript_13197/m.41652 type:complete len:85 (-) Transcript_13197:49-303(-)